MKKGQDLYGFYGGHGRNFNRGISLTLCARLKDQIGQGFGLGGIAMPVQDPFKTALAHKLGALRDVKIQICFPMQFRGRGNEKCF